MNYGKEFQAYYTKHLGKPSLDLWDDIPSIALGNETVKYVDIDVTFFDMTGISSTNSVLDKGERRKVFEELVPKSILLDYENHWQEIEMMKRIKRNKFRRSKLLY